MKAAVYCRVSTLEQAEQGYSLIAQQEKLEVYAKGMGYSIFNVYVDDGFSGKNLQRPAVTKLISDVKKGLINIVLIYKLDRLSRKVKDVLELVELFEQFNVSLFSLSENLDLSSPFGRAALKMSATFSELERETIVERMKMGKTQRAKSGKAMNHHYLPIGYDYDYKNDKFIPNPTEKEQVLKIFELYLQGWSISKISKFMNENYTNRYSSYNSRTAVSKVLANPFCCGYFYFGGEMHHATNIEPIIDYETWLRAETIRVKNKQSLRRVSSPYLLTGLIKCGICGRPYCAKKYSREGKLKNGQHKTYLHYSYGCTARVKFEKQYHEHKCTNDLLAMEQLNNLVIESVKNFKFTKAKQKDLTSKNSTIANIEAEIEALKGKIDKFINLYISDLITKDKLESTLKTINKEIAEKEKKKEILKQSAKNKEPELDIKQINEQINNFDTLTHLEKRHLLKNLIDSVVVYPGDVQVNFKA